MPRMMNSKEVFKSLYNYLETDPQGREVINLGRLSEDFICAAKIVGATKEEFLARMSRQWDNITLTPWVPGGIQ